MRRELRDTWPVAVTALVTGVLIVLALAALRQAALDAAERLADSLSRVIAEQTARTLQSVDARLQFLALQLEVLRRDGRLQQANVGPILRRQLIELPYVRALWLVDAQGRILFETGDASVGRDVGAMGYVQAFRRDASLELYIGRLERSVPTGRWMVPIARPLRGADGEVRQIVIAALDPPYFEQLWRRVDVGSTGAVTLFHRQGQLMVRSPPDENLTGRDFSGLGMFRDELARSPQGGSFLRGSAIDGTRRLVAFRELPTYPDLIVTVGLGYGEVLAPWRRFAALTGAVWFAAVVVAFLLTLELRRQARGRAQTEYRFVQLARAAPQIVFLADARGEVQFISDRWTELTGRPVDEALGSGWRARVHPADLPRMLRRIQQAVASGEDLVLENRLRTRDGSWRWQLLRAVAARAEGQAQASWYGTATDIDDMKRAQERLREQAERLRVAGRLTHMGVWRLDLPFDRLVLSDEAGTMLDVAPGTALTQRQMMAMLAPASAPRTVEAVRACLQRGEAFDLEIEVVTPTGRHVWVRSLGEPVRDAVTGEVVAIQGAQQEITLRVLMMEEIRRLNASLEERIAERTAQLARQDALFRTLAEQAPLPFWTVDPGGRVTFLSRAWYDLVGGAPPDWHGHAWVRLLHPDDVLDVQQNWMRSVTSGRPFVGTRRFRAHDGTYHAMTYRAEPVRDEGGEILFWVGVDTDITDLTANQAALRLANEQLEAFSYSVSHDLQSPLQRIASFTRLLQQELGADGSEKARHYLARIEANAETMSQLMEGLLALAHVSELSVIRAVVNLSELATGILQHLQSDHPQRQVEWHVEPGLLVLADARLMHSVLENLLGNAWKFTAHTAAARIEVGGSRERGEYFVRDNGCGFDMAYADRLFGTFQRLHGADEFPGTGIGLATVARAVTRMGGRVWAQAAPGEGATFYFTLPPAPAAS